MEGASYAHDRSPQARRVILWPIDERTCRLRQVRRPFVWCQTFRFFGDQIGGKARKYANQRCGIWFLCTRQGRETAPRFTKNTTYLLYCQYSTNGAHAFAGARKLVVFSNMRQSTKALTDRLGVNTRPCPRPGRLLGDDNPSSRRRRGRSRYRSSHCQTSCRCRSRSRQNRCQRSPGRCCPTRSIS